ncbi:MAG TPA: hypothetical protein VNI77_02315 [Nitrososphaera sp.]|nr:hypothetical protein [Nitrososphaera sp.]
MMFIDRASIEPSWREYDTRIEAENYITKYDRTCEDTTYVISTTTGSGDISRRKDSIIILVNDKAVSKQIRTCLIRPYSARIA